MWWTTNNMTVFRDNTTGHSSTLVLDKKKQLFSSQLTVRLQSSVYQCRLISSAFLTQGMEKINLLSVFKSRPVGKNIAAMLKRNLKKGWAAPVLEMNKIHYHIQQTNPQFLQPSHRPGVSRIRGTLSSLGSLTISWNAEIPMWPLPISSCRSRLQPSLPSGYTERIRKDN